MKNMVINLSDTVNYQHPLFGIMMGWVREEVLDPQYGPTLVVEDPFNGAKIMILPTQVVRVHAAC